MHTRSTALVTIVILAATLTACSDPGQGKAERATTASSKPAASPSGCGSDSDLSQADWMAKCAGASPAGDDQPDTELAVADTFAYTDGLKAKVDAISPITRYGAYDDKPDADQTAFRVTFTITNGTNKPYDLDNFGYDAQGATTGGQTESFYVEPGSKQMSGRLAPGRNGTFTAEYTIAKSDGKTIVVTLSRMDDAWLKDGSALAEEPHWTGDIK
ncbi:hypothetical protein NHG22_10585 [Streptomyces sp. ATE26]|uniref:hypothetical protein n=1 Tax=Streptomyces sp. ATE26 TaxID=2954237 RepID=UPI002482895D|nr:hypothetical protein [Streptomyces sp. ATE26]MDI1454257.1 hypothetical protein [Streptomyces sp. ATE26]